MGSFIDRTGQKFGSLTVVCLDSSSSKKTKWMCVCDCGGSASVGSWNLANGHTRSCGCLVRTHGHAAARGKKKPSPEYKTWQAMKERCYRSGHKFFKEYGGRGIKVCDRWLESFENFYADMGDRPEGTSIDRIDVNGDYCPENCRWLENEKQNANRRLPKNATMITAFGKTQHVEDWAREIGINIRTLRKRLHSGWSPERVISTPVDTRMSRR